MQMSKRTDGSRQVGPVRPVRLLATAALVTGALLVAGCGDSKKDKASQTAAKVNKEEITVHQINFVLQQQRGLRPDQTDTVSRQILERLIDQEVALQKADELKIDRDPRVVQQLEAARREIISRAYMERIGESASKPTPEEVQKYYNEKPALFKERRIYNIQEIAIEAKPEQFDQLRQQLEASASITQFVDFLKANEFKFSGNQAVRAAEQLPLASLDTFAALKDGQAMINASPTGAQVVVLAGSRSQPVDLATATPAIEQFLNNERRRTLIEGDIKALRAAASIQYVGKFAEGAASAAAGAASGAASSMEKGQGQ